MDNLITDVRDFVTDRFGSPFWISTVVSWLLVNWKISITGLFNPELINIKFLEQYFSETSFFYLVGLPIIIGLSYSILSGSLKESLEILAKAARSQLIRLDLSGKLYKSIPIDEHNKKIDRFKRQLEKIESEKIETEEILNQNDELNKIVEETDQRDIKLLDLIKAEVFEGNLDNQFKKMRFLKKMHDLNFGKIISEEDISGENQNETSKESLKGTTENAHENSPEIYITPTPILSDDHEDNPKDPDGRTKNNTIGKVLRTYEHEYLRDPNSHKTLLLTLLLVKGKSSLNERLDPTMLGLDPTVFNKTVDSALKSELLRKSGANVSLTPEGATKISELASYLSDQPVVKVLDDFYKKTKSEIISILQSRALTPAQVIRTVRYHPNAQEAINELLNNKTIVKQGNLLFPESITESKKQQK